MKQRYYLVGYGHVARWSKASTPAEASKDAFGLTCERITVLDCGTRSPKYMTYKVKSELYERLKKLHKEKTGGVLQ